MTATTARARTDDAAGGTPEPATAGTVAVKTPVGVGVPLRGLDEAYRLAQALAPAGLLPNSLRGKPADVLAIHLYGVELGLAPMQAIQGIYVVNGRPQLASKTLLALVRKAGHRAKVLEQTAETCTVWIRRGDTGEEHDETFTIDDAKRAKLAERDTWKQYPRQMLLARATSNCVNFICPEIALGFDVEGLDVAEPTAPRPSLAEVAALRDQPKPQDEPIDAEIVDDQAVREDLATAEAEFTAAVNEPPPVDLSGMEQVTIDGAP